MHELHLTLKLINCKQINKKAPIQKRDESEKPRQVFGQIENVSAKKVNNATPPLKKPPVRPDVIEAMEVDDPQPDPKPNVTFF